LRGVKLIISDAHDGIKKSSRWIDFRPKAITRLIGAILLDQNDERAVQRARHMTLETVAPLSDDPLVSLPPIAAA
jgi:hypothetical protein